VKIPVFRPIIGFKRGEIKKISKQIGTQDSMVRRVECATVVKKLTQISLEKIEELEKELNLTSMCVKAAEEVEINKFR
jgi:thiamine biosynthesis protein ThiI